MNLQRSPGIQRIGLTALIDVVFILLLFFMLATNFQQTRSIHLNAASDSVAPGQSDQPVLTLLLTAQSLEVEGRSIEMADLPGLMDQRLRAEPGLKVFIRGSAGVSLQRIVDVVDTLRSSRVTDYHLDVTPDP